jgi:hypothetical protein
MSKTIKTEKETILFYTTAEARVAEHEEYCNAHVIVVDDIIVKNRFGPEGIPYTGVLGFCNCCSKEIKVRELFLSSYIGCMC